MANAAELMLLIRADASGMDKGLGDARKGIGGLVDGLGRIGLAAGGLGAIAGGIKGIGEAAMGLIAGNAEFERYEVQLATLMGSADAAKERMVELAAFGASTPFELPEIARAEKVLIGFGLTGERALAMTGKSAEALRTVIGDVAAGTGVAFEEVAGTFGKFSAGEAGTAIARLQELGVVTKEQMSEVGIQFSKTGALLSPLPEAFAAATKIAEEKFGGGMAALSNTFEGKMSTLADTWGAIKRTLAAPLFDLAKAGLDIFLPALTELVTALETGVGPAVEIVKAAFTGDWGAVSEIGETLRKAFGADAGLGITQAAVGVGELATAFSEFASGDFSAGWNSVSQAITSVFSAIKNITGIDLSGIKEALFGDDDGNGGAWNAVGDAIDKAAGFIKDDLIPALTPVGKWMSENKPLILAVAEGFAAFAVISTIAGPIASVGTSFITFGTSIASAVTSLGGLVAFLGGPVTVAIGAAALIVAGLYLAWTNNFGGIQEKTAAVWGWIQDNVVPVISRVADDVIERITDLKAQFDEHFGGIQGVAKGLIDWFNAHVAPTFAAVFGFAAEQLSQLWALFEFIMPAIQLLFSGVFDVVVGVIRMAFGIIKGLVEAGLGLMRGDFEAVFNGIRGAASAFISNLGPIFFGLIKIISGAFAAAIPIAIAAVVKLGEAIIKGLVNFIVGSATVIAGAIAGVVEGAFDAAKRLIPGFGGGGGAPSPAPPPGRGGTGPQSTSLFSTDVNATFGPSSPGTQAAVAAATASGEAVADGLREGLSSIETVIQWLNDTIAKTIGQRDVESLVQVATAIGAIRDTVVGIIEATEAAFAFKLPATADEVRARFQGLIDGFRNVIMDFKGLSASADKGETSGAGLLSKWDIPNVGAMSGALKNIADVLVGLSGALEAADKVKAIGPDVLTRLGESVTALGKLARDVVKQFGADFGTESASAAVGHVASALGSFASALKAVADLDLGGVVALNASKLRVAATAANVMLAELRTLAAEFIAMDKDARTAIVDGVAAYASLVGSAVDALGAAAGLDLSKVVTLNATMMQVAGTAASVLVAHVRTVAAAFIAMDGDVRDGIVAGVQAFSDLVSAAASILSAASGAAEGLAKATKIDAALLTEHLTHLRDVVVPAVRAATDLWTMAVEDTKALTERIGAFAALLSAAVGAHSLIPSGELAAKAKINAAELGEHLTHLRDVVLPVVLAIVDVWTETLDDTKVMTERVAAFAALLSAAVGSHTLIPTGELAARSKIDAHELGVHLIHLRDYVLPVVLAIVDVWGQGVEEAKAMTEKVSAFAGLMSAVVGAHSLIPTGELKAHAQINADALRDSLTHLRDTVLPVVVELVKGWGVGTDEAKALSEHVGAFGSVIGGIVSLYGSIAGMSTDPVVALAASSLETFKANTRVLLAAMSEIMGDGGLDAEAAKAKSAAAEAVSAIADAFGGVFEVVEAALASPFAKVRAGGQRGDTFRTNIKNRIVASLRESVAAIQEALSGLTITIPPGIKDQMQGLADAFSPILDLIERLNGVTVDLKQLRTLALAPAILAAGLIPTGTTTGAGPGGSIIITNTFEPTVSPLPITIHNVNNNTITVGERVIDAIAIEVVNVQEAELRLKP